MDKIDGKKLPTNTYSSGAGQKGQDGGTAAELTENFKLNTSVNDEPTIYRSFTNSDFYKMALHGSNLFTKDEIDLYSNIYRFGLYNPYGAVTNLKEYLFFTKPDLNILTRKSTGELIGSLNDNLVGSTFWQEINNERRNTLAMLQNSYVPGWNKLLQNSVISNLEIPALEGTTVESPVNNYGVGFQYRGTSEASDDSIDFTLEFKDTKWLDIYYFFRAYEDYETLKHHGLVSPWEGYITNRILHDQFAIYKFMVGDDMETIVYWCKLYGVMPMGLPRDVFSQTDFSNGLSYTISFKAAFFEDMRLDIISDFNDLSKYYNMYDTGYSKYYQLETYNSDTGTGDFRPAKSAYIQRFRRDDSPTGWVYKLKWKGDKKF